MRSPKILGFMLALLLVAATVSMNIAPTRAQDLPAECKPGSTLLNFWHGLTGPDGAYLGDLVKQYNKDNTDNLCITVTTYNWYVFFDKWLSGVAAGNPPDAVVFHINEVPQYATLGAMEPMDDLAKQVGLDISGFPQT